MLGNAYEITQSSSLAPLLLLPTLLPCPTSLALPNTSASRHHVLDGFEQVVAYVLHGKPSWVCAF